MLSGGGSAALKPSYFISPYDGIVKALKEIDEDIEVTYSEGARSQSCFRPLIMSVLTLIPFLQLTGLCLRWITT